MQAAGGDFRSTKDPSSMNMRLKLGACTLRAAFSHVPFIQAIIWMANTMILQPSPGNLTADTNLPVKSAVEKVCSSPECLG